jgi:hypothetical protein
MEAHDIQASPGYAADEMSTGERTGARAYSSSWLE